MMNRVMSVIQGMYLLLIAHFYWRKQQTFSKKIEMRGCARHCELSGQWWNTTDDNYIEDYLELAQKATNVASF